jgi:hypothetical protein
MVVFEKVYSLIMLMGKAQPFLRNFSVGGIQTRKNIFSSFCMSKNNDFTFLHLLSSQFFPAYPFVHEHVYSVLDKLVHVPLFRQGLSLQAVFSEDDKYQNINCNQASITHLCIRHSMKYAVFKKSRLELAKLSNIAKVPWQRYVITVSVRSVKLSPFSMKKLLADIGGDTADFRKPLSESDRSIPKEKCTEIKSKNHSKIDVMRISI